MQLSVPHRSHLIILPLLALLAAALGVLLLLAPGLFLVGTVVVGVVALGVLFLILLQKDSFLLLAVILLLMPFHTIVSNLIELYTGSTLLVTAFSVWKEGMLFLLLVVQFVARFILQRQPLTVRWELMLPLLFMIVGILFLPSASSIGTGIMAYRYIFQGMLVVLLTYTMRPSIERVLRFLPWLVGQASIISLWGIYSRYFLDFHSYLQQFGFISTSISPEQLQYSSVFAISANLFLRANSIFVGPNEFGLYLAILIVATIAVLRFYGPQLKRSERWYYIFAILLMAAGEIATVSRNSWVFIIVAIGVLILQTPGILRKLRIMFVLFLVLALIILAIPNMRLFVARTIQLQDSSARGRASEIGDRLGILATNPLGIGLGRANYKLITNDENHVHTEFYLILIGLELGWLGLALYLATMANFLIQCLALIRARDPSRRLAARLALALLCGTLASQVLAVITMDWLFQYYLWFFVGTALFGRVYTDQHPVVVAPQPLPALDPVSNLRLT